MLTFVPGNVPHSRQEIKGAVVGRRINSSCTKQQLLFTHPDNTHRESNTRGEPGVLYDGIPRIKDIFYLILSGDTLFALGKA